MRYIDTFREGMHIADVYLCKNKQIALTKNGKDLNLISCVQAFHLVGAR